jgi:putative membrane protein
MNYGLKRYHPAFIAVEIVSFLKSVSGFYLFLFVLKAGSTSNWVLWGRGILLMVTFWTIFSSFLKWQFHRYEIKDDSIKIHEGVYIKKQLTVPLDSIQNHHSNTTFVHRWFGLTSLTLETGTSGESSSFQFPVITETEKERILSYVEHNKAHLKETDNKIAERLSERQIRFQATKKDILKASFTSLNFLFIFPLLVSIYFNLTDFFQIEKAALNALDYLLIQWWVLIVLFVIALILSVGLGYIKTSIQYGNYLICDDEERIYIEKGIGNVISFSILKHRVQAVMIEQSILKRIFGLVSIKLISAGSAGGEDQQTSSLYPFMPKYEAYQVLQAMLPDYHIEEHMERFPVKVLWLKLLQPYYLTILVFIGLMIFKKEWLWLAGIVFAATIITRFLDYWFTSYLRHGKTLQVRNGGLSTKTFVTHRERIQQITVKHSMLQRKFGVATIIFINKAKPLHVSELYGISKEEASNFYTWYHSGTWRRSNSGQSEDLLEKRLN